MKKLIISLFIVIISLFAFLSFFFFREVRYFIGRASVSQASFSVDNSYVFVTPLRAPANGRDKIRINVFILSAQGLGVLGKQVILGSTQDVNVEAIQVATDQYGKAIYDVSSNKPGEYYIEIKVDTVSLPQKAHLSFY